MMVELIGVHRPDHEDVVGTGGQMRGVVAEIHPAFAVFGELAVAPLEARRFFFDEREAHFLGQRFGQRLAVHLVELGFGIPQVDLAGRPFQKNENARLGARRKVRRLGRQRIDGCFGGTRTGCRRLFTQQRTQCCQAHAITGRLQKVTPRLVPGKLS